MITLTSDFGLKDPYVAEMKGVILTINPNAIIVDITHNIEKFNIGTAAFILASVASYFPKDTIHLAVVDPEVGSERRAIVIQTKHAFFVGPDNGVLMLAAQNQEIAHTYELLNPNLMLPKTSNTFHGRDIFAPVAAYIDKGVKPNEFGPEIRDPHLPSFPKIKRSNYELTGEVLYIDSFGNVITNIKENDMIGSQKISLELNEISLNLKFGKAYAEAERKEPIILIGSYGFVEIAINQGNAAEKFRAKLGDKIRVTAA
jgi:S-adenosyl-L-methionine hydrolase (adenosine-forming)